MTEIDPSFIDPPWLDLLKRETTRLLRSLIRHGIIAGMYLAGASAWVHWHG